MGLLIALLGILSSAGFLYYMGKSGKTFTDSGGDE
ncbi:hypothetical protein N781_09520 [Pontibacillus halophilus JSM 076056 = DSM 19796]|uniref:Uncharacterized protein n=1 Tax=Pontibacillus halophilus JSM 076056 = DSM 19796 TaxID=1385510 RepID=A0A0A5HYQ4_9BACI|nr:hypothetical protein N781_09520 [Pontibacillus halophilus JSM 076056 = DSM 19796]